MLAFYRTSCAVTPVCWCSWLRGDCARSAFWHCCVLALSWAGTPSNVPKFRVFEKRRDERGGYPFRPGLSLKKRDPRLATNGWSECPRREEVSTFLMKVERR